MTGWYYLHVNGDLIYKRELGGTAADIRESDFAKAMWPVDQSNRECPWRILVEGLALGARKDRIMELAKKWGCDDQDAKMYAAVIGIDLEMEGDKWQANRKDFVNIQESPCGFGSTILEAMAELAKNLGLQPSKMWGATFQDLVKV